MADTYFRHPVWCHPLESLLSASSSTSSVRNIRFLATVGRHSTVQALERRERRYQILLALVAQSAVDQPDEVALFDQAVSARESSAKSKTDEALVEGAKSTGGWRPLRSAQLRELGGPARADKGLEDPSRPRSGG
jgi:hypothetical protein